MAAQPVANVARTTVHPGLRSGRRAVLPRVRHPRPRSARSSPARSVSARSRSPTTSRRGDPEDLRRGSRPGPTSIWRYAPLLPVPADVATKPNLNPGWTKLVKADNLARELGMTGGLYVKDDSGNPTHSFKDRVVAVALEAARAFGFDHPVLLLHRQPGRRGRRRGGPRRACARACSSRTTWRQGKVVMAAVYGGKLVGIEGTYDDVNRFCSELIGDPAGEGWGFVNVNLRPYYARGLQDAGLRDRRAARLAAARTSSVIPIASGSQLTKIDKGLQELIKLGLVEDKPYKIFGAQADGLLAGVRGLQGRATTWCGR